MDHRRFAKARDQQPRARACSRNSSGAYACRHPGGHAPERVSACLPKESRQHKIIVHQQLGDDTKDKEDKGIRRCARLMLIALSKRYWMNQVMMTDSPAARRFHLCGLPY